MLLDQLSRLVCFTLNTMKTHTECRCITLYIDQKVMPASLYNIIGLGLEEHKQDRRNVTIGGPVRS